MNTTPGGFHYYIAAPPGFPERGTRVRVVASRSVIDWPYTGLEGVVLGYSIPHSYAIVRCDKQPDPSSQFQEILLHPESLEIVT